MQMMIQEREEEQLRRIQEIRNKVRVQGIDPIYKHKSHIEDQFILNCLKNHFVFYNLSQAQLINVKDYMWWTEIPPGMPVFREGSIGTCFFIIQTGVVQVQTGEEVIKVLKSGDGFGELALLYDLNRPSTVVVRQNAGFWVLDKSSFKQAVQQIVIKDFEQNQKYLEGQPFYQYLTNSQKEKVASSFVTIKYYKGQNIIQEGDPGSAFYLIKNGTASLIQGNVEERKIYRGESFGVNSLYYNTMRRMTVRAQDEVTCQVLGRETLSKIMGVDSYRETMFRNYVKYAFQKNKQLLKLIKKNEEKAFENMKIRYYKTNEVVYKKGSIVHKICVIMEGRIKKFRSANILAQSSQIWGDNYLQPVETRLEDDIITQTESVLIEINLENLRSVMEEVSVRKKEPFRSIIWDKPKISEILYLGRIENQSASCSLHYLKHKDKKLIGKLYKMSDLEKQQTIEIFKDHLLVTESLQHIFLPHYHQTIEYRNYKVVISDFIAGESLYDVIRNIGLLSTSDSQFYVATMILLLQHCSNYEIVLRDLKPDNFIVDQKGYLYLVSLGSSKCIQKSHRTSTIIGTPHYMAPEVVLGKQYNQLVDLWAVGVMMYEFMVGKLPFGAETQNPYQIYEQIIQGDTVFPKTFKDRRAKKLIQSILSLNPQTRHNGSYTNLKNNSWFENINWDELNDKNISTPYKPSSIKQFKDLQRVNNTLEDYLSNLQ